SCARLMKLPPDKIAAAVGISVSLASGIPANYGTMTKPLHSGNAARNGVLAASLASRGFTAGESGFEASTGFYKTLARGLETSLQPFGDFGKRHDIVELGFRIKAYPCGGRGHPAIEAALAFRERYGNSVADITNVHCTVTRSTAARVGTEWPKDVEAA